MLILAHRGAHEPETAGVGENTLAAFTDIRVDGVELDVRTSADGVLVVHHDPVVADGRAIARTASADLPAAVPTFAAALTTLRGVALINVEIKNNPLEPGFDAQHGMIGPIARAVAGWPVLVSSFNLATLDAFHAAAPEVRTGWLTGPGYDQLAAVADAAARGHAALNPYEGSVTAELVGAAHAAGLAIVAWTVNDAGRLRVLQDLGVDVVVTDRPGLAASVLA
jgi:glycerophosphoryl diester phosphodiesterase